MNADQRTQRRQERIECGMTKKEYIRQVKGHLRCSKRKRQEIEKQLDSHIGIGLNEGRRLEEILAEMGEPKALAEEFNDNFEENERKKGRVHRWVIVLVVVAALILTAAAVLYWLIPKERDINNSRFFDPDILRTRAEEVIISYGEEDYGTFDGYLSKEIRKAFEGTSMESVRLYICENWGEFRSMGNMYMTEVRQRGRSYAIVQVNASFENVSVVFTLTFNEDMELYGFYVK